MIAIEGRRIEEVFDEAVTLWGERDFLVAPQRDGAPMRSLTYAQADALVAGYAAALDAAGYGAGHRIAVCVGTCPEHYLLKLAMARLGISFVPVNPDYRPGELAYVLEDSGAVLGLADAARAGLMRAAIAEGGRARFGALEVMDALPQASFPAPGSDGGPLAESGLLYTSGTTGQPKGCILSHEYELMIGAVYPGIKLAEPMSERDRIFNPLPAFHVNAGVVSFIGVMLVGAAQIQPERFSASTWWRDLGETRATIFHYLGVVIAVLLADRDAGPELLGDIRAGLGAGVEPALHVEFERRFGIPLIEVWGMTEMCRVMVMDEEPRMTATRAFGRPRADLEVQVWDEACREVPRGQPGEMVLRHSGDTPKKGFFSGYLNKMEATVEAWKGGWFHTGDTVTMDEAGILYFVDRKKNIIRRAGENIAAAEVENVLMADERVVNVACVAAPDEVREEEVLACVVLAGSAKPDEATARAIFDQAFEKLAYYKAPGWILFVPELPVTGTQKVVKHKLFEPGEDPRRRPGIFDFRGLKKKG